MPKDPTKNIFQYKIRGGQLNEFEFHQNQGQVTQQHDRPWEKQNFDPNAAMPGEPEPASPKAQAKHSRSAATAVKPAGKTSQKGSKKATKKQAAKTASKSGAKKTTRRSTGKKATTKASAGKKAGKAAAKGRAKKAFKKRKLRAGVR